MPLRLLGRFCREIAYWLIPPLVAVALSRWYSATFLQLISPPRDPRAWDFNQWLIQLGPISGFSFLVGCTVASTSVGARNASRRAFDGRVLLVFVGPWFGFLCWFIAIWLLEQIAELWQKRLGPLPNLPEITLPELVATILGYAILCLSLSYAWVWLAWRVLVRAARRGCLSRAFASGVASAFLFLGTLFGGFWALTSMFREYFFDKRVLPLLLVCVLCVGLSGCANTETVGDVRRRDLFEAMLLAWVLGLSLMWRWWHRTQKSL